MDRRRTSRALRSVRSHRLRAFIIIIIYCARHTIISPVKINSKKYLDSRYSGHWLAPGQALIILFARYVPERVNVLKNKFINVKKSIHTL